MRRIVGVGAALFLLLNIPLHADRIQLQSGKIYKRAVVQDVRRGKLQFRPAGAAPQSVELSEVRTLSLPAHRELNEAEKLFDAGRFEAAARSYETLTNDLSQPWQRRWARYRLLRCHDRQGNFDRVVECYAVLVAEMPEAAPQLTPANWPDPSSTFYPDALATVEEAIRQASDTRVVQALRQLQTLIDNQRADDDAATASGAGLNDAGVEDEEDALAHEYGLVEQAFARKAYAKAIELADALMHRSENGHPEPLLLIKGQAQFRRAQTAEDYLQAALTLMRVVIHFPGSAEAAPAGYYAALAHERAGLPAAAKTLLEEAARRAAEDEDELREQIELSLRRVAKKVRPTKR